MLVVLVHGHYKYAADQEDKKTARSFATGIGIFFSRHLKRSYCEEKATEWTRRTLI